ncbi:hypothetical protein OQX61_07230 [Pedobacter sp. PLR]|uniref:hypothetical protein n=1 Tax=Pedobacter sp. PLR TaxID=2994465 RepID=UPI0022458A36|nr:hypothetical protein [Pedobacter sp. PLR]MCX2451061.1 hypothetical protein [Pedobacter sp. PLR]
MKKQLTFATVLLFMIAGITTGCKKETGESRSLKKKVEGKWLVSKVETTIAGGATSTYVGLPTDFFEFRNDEKDQLDVNIGTERSLGTYAVLATDDINMVFSGKVLHSTINSITDNSFEFTATVDGSNPKETRKYSLRR